LGAGNEAPPKLLLLLTAGNGTDDDESLGGGQLWEQNNSWPSELCEQLCLGGQLEGVCNLHCELRVENWLARQ